MRAQLWGHKGDKAPATKERGRRIYDILKRMFCEATKEFRFILDNGREVCETRFFAMYGIHRYSQTLEIIKAIRLGKNNCWLCHRDKQVTCAYIGLGPGERTTFPKERAAMKSDRAAAFIKIFVEGNCDNLPDQNVKVFDWPPCFFSWFYFNVFAGVAVCKAGVFLQ